MQDILDTIDWKKILIKKYKSLGFNESQLALLLVRSQLSGIIGNDTLGQMMTLNVSDIDEMMHDLIQKEYLQLNDDGSIDFTPLIKKLHSIFLQDINTNNLVDLGSNQKKEIHKNIFNIIENEFTRPLTNSEIDITRDWIDKYTYDEIIEAIRSSLTSGNKSLRYISRVLADKHTKNIGGTAKNRANAEILSYNWLTD